MSYDTNVYYNPKKSGLVQIDSLDEPGLSYEYNTLCVWQDTKTKRVFYVQDSGCSCPTPFEGYFYRAAGADTNLDEVKETNFFVFEQAVNNFPVQMSERQDLIKKVADLLAKNGNNE